MSNVHVPVLLDEVLLHAGTACAQASPAYVADVTLGGAGHTSAILKQLPQTIVTAMDFDENAIALAQQNLKEFITAGRVHLVHAAFTELPPTPDDQGYHAILADLGYSSNQLDNKDIGMSFQNEGPLDMRLARPPHGPRAWDLLNNAPLDWLSSVFRDYGEIGVSKKLAHRIREAVQQGDITDSTKSLAHWLAKYFPSLGSKTRHAATTVFQALRIAVNDELRALDEFLNAAILRLRPGGQLLVITFHSLEDRIVKRHCGARRDLKMVTKKPIEPTLEELKQNPRSRSAKLRVYVKST